MWQPPKLLLFSFALFTLSGCSGGGGDSAQAPVPQLSGAPTISSATSVNVGENSSSTVYTIVATDPQNEPITYAISGTDASAFTVEDTTGRIRFITPPDFESPGDTDGSNDYLIEVSATDSSNNTARLTVTITVTDINETAQRYLERVFQTVDVQQGIEFAPGLFLDLYVPSGDSATDRPVMIVASGGGFVAQDRENVEPIAREFAQRGYVAATIDYRVLARQPMTADELSIAGIQATHDMFAAVRFIRADSLATNQYGTRPDATFVSGESAGGVMAAIAATLDPGDVVASVAVSNYLSANGGAYGNVGDNDSVSSIVQGSMPLSGAILEISTVDSQSATLYAAHEEFDPVVPCNTAAEASSFTGLVISGACALLTAYTNAGATAELFLVAGSMGHVEFTDAQRQQIYAGASTLFFNEVISP